MNMSDLTYKMHEPALLNAFEKSKFRPEVDVVTYSDMIATGGVMYSSRVKLSFTTKSDPFMRCYMYIPGSLISEQHYLSEDEKAAVEMWINSVHLAEASLKQRSNNKV